MGRDGIIRCFLAMTPPRPLAGRCLEGARKSLPADLPLRWQEVETLHLTLRFLGDLDEGQVAALLAPLGALAEGLPSFSLRFDGMGVFASSKGPRVLWMGVEDEGGACRRLREALELLLDSMGHGRDSRPYHPHLTLGRFRRPPARAFSLPNPESAFATGGDWCFTVDAFHLYRSELRPEGARYLRLASFPLGPKNGA